MCMLFKHYLISDMRNIRLLSIDSLRSNNYFCMRTKKKRKKVENCLSCFMSAFIFRNEWILSIENGAKCSDFHWVAIRDSALLFSQCHTVHWSWSNIATDIRANIVVNRLLRRIRLLMMLKTFNSSIYIYIANVNEIKQWTFRRLVIQLPKVKCAEA